MSAFKTYFQAYGGNYTTTMERFMGNEALYVRLLEMFTKDETMSQLDAALEQGDLEGAFRACHTLKGVAGNLGLEPLYQAICAMVEPLRQREEMDYTAMHEEVSAQFRRAESLLAALKEEG